MDPLDPVNREIQVNRLKALKETYPEAEGYLPEFPGGLLPAEERQGPRLLRPAEQQALFQELRR